MNFLIVLGFCLILITSCFLIAYIGRAWNLSPIAAMGSGGLLSICLLDFLPHNFEGDKPHEWISIFILSGILIQSLADIYLLPKLGFLDQWLKGDFSKIPHSHSHTLSSGSVCSIMGCLSLCSFFDGIRLFSSLYLDKSAAFSTAIALFLHLFSEAAIVTALTFSSGFKKQLWLFFVTCLAGSLFVGALAAQIFLLSLSGEMLIAFSSGILLYICLIHLLPFAMKPKNKLWFFIGLLVFSLIHFIG